MRDVDAGFGVGVSGGVGAGGCGDGVGVPAPQVQSAAGQFGGWELQLTVHHASVTPVPGTAWHCSAPTLAAEASEASEASEVKVRRAMLLKKRMLRKSFGPAQIFQDPLGAFRRKKSPTKHACRSCSVISGCHFPLAMDIGHILHSTSHLHLYLHLCIRNSHTYTHTSHQQAEEEKKIQLF